MNEELNTSQDNFVIGAMESIRFIPEQRGIFAPYIKTEANKKIFVIDAQQTADIETGDIAVYRSVSGCTILEVEFEDRVEVYHISAGTFLAINQDRIEELEGNEKFFARKVAKLGQKT